ncbi:hypothetical protein ACOMHN_004513 [Nucella lapillus]
MAGDSMVIDSSSNRVLWQFISGTGVLRPQELIEHEVNRNKSRLLNGLLYYKPHSGAPGVELKKERKVAGRQLEFVLKLSKFLDVSEVLCHDLFCAFLFNDYRGSKKTLKQVLSHERHSQALMLKIRDFYFTERLYLLRCLHHMLVHRTQHHPYQDVYNKFCKEVQDNGESLQDKILKQLTAVCEVVPPAQDRHGSLMTNVQVQAWVIQNLKEQCELLEMGVMVHKDCAMKHSTLLAYLRVFKVSPVCVSVLPCSRSALSVCLYCPVQGQPCLCVCVALFKVSPVCVSVLPCSRSALSVCLYCPVQGQPCLCCPVQGQPCLCVCVALFKVSPVCVSVLPCSRSSLSVCLCCPVQGQPCLCVCTALFKVSPVCVALFKVSPVCVSVLPCSRSALSVCLYCLVQGQPCLCVCVALFKVSPVCVSVLPCSRSALSVCLYCPVQGQPCLCVCTALFKVIPVCVSVLPCSRSALSVCLCCPVQGQPCLCVCTALFKVSPDCAALFKVSPVCVSVLPCSRSALSVLPCSRSALSVCLYCPVQGQPCLCVCTALFKVSPVCAALFKVSPVCVSVLPCSRSVLSVCLYCPVQGQPCLCVCTALFKVSPVCVSVLPCSRSALSAALFKVSPVCVSVLPCSRSALSVCLYCPVQGQPCLCVCTALFKVSPVCAALFKVSPVCAALFKKHGFGLYQMYKHLLDESTEKYIHRIRHLEMVMVMQGIHVGTVMQCWTNHSFAESIVSKKEHFEAIQTEINSLGSDPVHGPILLAWAMVRHFYLTSDPHSKEAAETRRLGKVALQHGAFRLLLDMLQSEPFAGTSVVGAVTHYTVYQLMHAVSSVFQEDTLGSPAVLCELCILLLRQPAVAEDVWEKDDGLWLLYESAMGYFPLDFSRFVGMTEALASASTESAVMVKDSLKELGMYTEYLDNNSARHLQPSPHDPNGFTLTVDKRPYLAGDFVIPRGCSGQVLELSALSQGVSEELSGPLMRWSVTFNGWSLLLDEVGELLRQITHGAGMVQGEQVKRVTMVIELVHHILKGETATTMQEFAPFLALCYDIVHRFSVLRPAPLDLLSAALNCIACAAAVCPKEVWHKVTQTGLLPYLTENVDDLGEVLNGRGLNSGALGSIQAGTECTQARYPLTLAVLDMLITFVTTFSQEGMEEELLACLLHILREVFPLFRKWRYTHLAHRKLIGQQCQKLFHKVLNLIDTVTVCVVCAGQQCLKLFHKVLNLIDTVTVCVVCTGQQCLKLFHKVLNLIDTVTVCVVCAGQQCLKLFHKVLNLIDTVTVCVVCAGQQCLKLFHKVLNLIDTVSQSVRPPQVSEASSGQQCLKLFHKVLNLIDTVTMCVVCAGQQCLKLFHKVLNLIDTVTVCQQCLKLFHKVLNLTRLSPTSGSKPPGSPLRPSVHEVCVYSLLFTEAGRALMEIVATGVDNVETALLQQGSLTEGGGVDLIELIQLSLSALSWQPTGRQSQHVVATMAQYIYHRHNPKLPTLATLLLKRLALMSPLSILACLGNDAEPIRDIYLTRLQALSEDLRLKVAILELLSVCVETQPGLIEIFFDVQVGPSESADGKKGLELGRSSCLQTLLTLMDVQKQTTYHCPPDLLRAGLDLVHSLWRGRRETAMEALRSKQLFWASVTAPLKRDLLPTNGDSASDIEVDPTDMKIVAFSFRILAQEIYSVEGSRVDPQLKTCLQDLGKADRILYWSECVRSSLHIEGSTEDVCNGNLSDNPTILLLKAWRNFLLVVSRSKVAEDLQLIGRRREEIMAHLLDGLQTQFRGGLSVVNMKVAAIVTALYFTLLKAWGSGVGKPAAVLVGVRGTVEETCGSSRTLMPSVQIGLLAALTLLLQRARGEPTAALTPAAISTLVPVTSAMLLQSTRQLPAPAELTQSKMDTSLSAAEHQQTEALITSKLTLQVTLCSLLTEIVMSTEVSSWLPHLQEHGVLTALLVSVETYLKAKQGLSYVHSALLLLTAVADSHQGATMLQSSDFTAHTCLALVHLYLQDDLLPMPTFTPKGGVCSAVMTWHGVYCLSVDLYTLMLQQLGFSFLDDALNLLGAHQDRLQQSLELARVTLLEAAMTEAECTCNFLHQVALYRRQWRLHLPHTMMTLLSGMLAMVQTFVSLLIRPRYLQHILERGGESGEKRKRSLQSSPLLQHQTSTDDVDHPTSQLIATENSMLRIIGRCMALLRSFSPDLCQVLLDQSMEMCEYDPLVDLGFSTPSVDQESPLTFGSLISCVTACLRRLYKEHKSPSPHRVQSPHRKSPRPASSSEPQVPKALLHYVMENCLTLAMSQACRYLREPSLPPRDKHFLKRELGTELNSFLSSMLRHFRRGATPGSPGDKSTLISPQGGGGTNTTSTITTTSSSAGPGLNRSLSQTTFSNSQDQHFFRLVQEFVRKVLR